ncbi:Gfo/Idh/MocA family protein [Bacillus solitudinis]|uniref:Gfo/Idh/MocA family protein n=1 Tax=Bacillus solitudinis TaxID=2014074 RepID=UPI000C242DAC|nr:Gfo/Idh/MocA family oxidoreductase [Bacillus solitudinis]
MRKVKLGVIGCGHISGIYLKNCSENFDILQVHACADLFLELAQKRAKEFNIPNVYTVEELLSDPEIEIVLNLTDPKVHAEINLKILESGKHVYSEKPLALNKRDAELIIETAREKNLRVGCAPDTFFGAGLQTCRKIIEDGWIGKPYAANAQIIMGHAFDAMHPKFPSLLKYGWDPLFDMGPYYLTALVHLLGPAKKVAGSVGSVQEEFKVSNPKSAFFDEVYPIEAPLHISAIVDFENDVSATLQFSKESFGYTPKLEIYGTEGILSVPDPNFFGGDIILKQSNGEIKEFPYSHSFTEDARGIGIADMAYAINSGRNHRANGELARHVLDISFGILESSENGRFLMIEAQCEQPEKMPLGLKYNHLDN